MDDLTTEWLMARKASEADLILLTIFHPMMETLRLVKNRVAIVSRGQTFEPSWFDLDIVNDDNEFAKSQLTVPNVNRVISKTLRNIIGPAEVTIEVVNSSLLDTPFHRAARFKLRNINVDPNFVTGDLSRGDENSETCGTIKMTPSRAPAIFRL